MIHRGFHGIPANMPLLLFWHPSAPCRLNAFAGTHDHFIRRVELSQELAIQPYALDSKWDSVADGFPQHAVSPTWSLPRRLNSVRPPPFQTSSSQAQTSFKFTLALVFSIQSAWHAATVPGASVRSPLHGYPHGHAWHAAPESTYNSR